MKAGCLTKSLLKIDAGGGRGLTYYIANSRGVARCIWYNDKKLWSGGYNLSGSKLSLWINSCSTLLAASKRAYSSQNTTFYLELVFKKNLNAPRPSEYPPVRGKKCQNV